MPTEQEVLDKWAELKQRRNTGNDDDLIDLLKWAGVTIDPPRTVWDDLEQAWTDNGWINAKEAVKFIKDAGFTLIGPDSKEARKATPGEAES